MSLEQSIERKNKALEREQAKLSASQNIYNKVQQKLNSLSNEYKSLAVQKELTGKLTTEEAKRYDFLQGKIQKYDATLKAVDATMGKHQRNVGNYASGFNPLSNSINQLTREMPAFTYSVQTGFMALSNNIPIFTDAIGNAIKQNKELVAQGKPTTSVLSQLAGAFLSWQTLLGVGITLLTVYGKEIGEWIGNLTKASGSINAIKEAQKQLNEVNVQGQKNAVEETLKLKSLLEIAKDTSLSYKERVIAVKELQDTYPAYFENLTQEQILAGKTAEAENALTEAILSRAKANAAIGKITENQAKIIDLEEKRFEIQKQIAIANTQITTTEEKLAKATNVSASQGIALSQTYERRAKLLKQLAGNTSEINDIQTVNNRLTDYAIQKQKEAILLDYSPEKQKALKEKREEIEAIKMQNIEYGGLLPKLIALRDAFAKQRDETSQTTNRYKELNKEVENYQKLIDAFIGKKDLLKDAGKKGTESFNEMAKAIKNNEEALRKLEEITSAYLKTFETGFFSEAGLPTLLKVMRGEIIGFKTDWEVTFTTMAEIAQEAFNLISQASNANFENEYNNLERQRDVALAFAGDSEAGRAEIEAQYESRRRAIQRRELEAKKRIALFNIAIDTVQAAVASLRFDPTGITAAIITAIGIAQSAVVASQEIPQFWKGTDNAPEGLAWTQEKGREVILDKNGNVKSTGSDKGAQLTYLNRGDKVLNNAKSMDFLMFNNDLNNILTGNGINSPKVEINQSGMSDTQVNAIVSAIENKAEFSQLITNGDLKTVVRKGNTETEIMNRRRNFIGKSV